MLLLIAVAVLIVGCMLIELVYRPRNSTRSCTRFLAWLRDWRDALRVSQCSPRFRAGVSIPWRLLRTPRGSRDTCTAAG